MDLDKIVDFITKHAAEQSSGIVRTLYRPTAIFQPVHVPSGQPSGAVFTAEGTAASDGITSERPAPEVLVFFAINLVLGTVVNKLIPGRRDGPDILATMCFSFGLAFFASLILHIFCKMLAGRGSFWMTFCAYLQVSSTVFVVSSFCALFWGSITKPPQITEFLDRYSSTLAFLGRNPISVFFIAQVLLLGIYLPLVLVSVHRFGFWKSAIVGWTFVTLSVIFSGLVYIAIGLTHQLAAYTY